MPLTRRAYIEADEEPFSASSEQSPAPNSASPMSVKGTLNPFSSASSPQTIHQNGRVIVKTESLTSLCTSDISEDLVNSMPELSIDSEGSSSGTSHSNSIDAEDAVRGLIPLFAAPPPIPPTTEAMLKDKSICMLSFIQEGWALIPFSKRTRLPFSRMSVVKGSSTH